MSTVQRQMMSFSPVGYWPLSTTDVSGSTVFDRSGNGRNGTSAGSPTMNRVFLDGRSYMDFDGSDDLVSIGDNSAFSPEAGASGLITMMCFGMRDITHANIAFMVTKGASAQYECDLGITAANTVFGQCYTLAGTGSGPVDTVVAVPVSQWHHFAFTYDKAANVHKMYWNGVQTDSKPIATTSADGGGPLQFGRRADGGGVMFNGAIAHVGLFNTALTAAQVNAVAQAGLRSGVAY